jgi:mRNA interferase HicA
VRKYFLTSVELKRWLERRGCTFGTQRGSHLKVYYGGRGTILPMHPKKELKTGTVEGIKKRLGLK